MAGGWEDRERKKGKHNEDMGMGREEEWKAGYDFGSLNSSNWETWEQGSSRPRKNLAKINMKIKRMS